MTRAEGRDAVLVALLSLAASHAAHFLLFSGGATYEFCQYGEIARNLLEGKGLTTQVFWPGELAVLAAAGKGSPEYALPMSRYPLSALWTALWLPLGGGGDYGRALSGMVGAALWAAAVRVFLGRLWGARAGLWAAAFWALNPVVTAGYALEGYVEPLYGAAVLWILWRLVTGGRPMEAFLLGAAAQGLHGSFIVVAPAFAAAAAAMDRARWRSAAALLGGAFVMGAAWSAVLSLGASAAPPLLLWNLMDGALTGRLPAMSYAVPSWSAFASLPAAAALLFKAWRQLNGTLADLPALWGIELLVPAAVLGFVQAQGAARRAAFVAGAALAWALTVFSFLTHERLVFLGYRYFVWSSPLVAAAAAAALLERWDRGRGWRLAGAACLALQLQQSVWLYASRRLEGDASRAAPVESLPELDAVRRLVPAGATVLTNMPAQVAWYARRRAVALPHEAAGAFPLRELHRASFLLLSMDGAGEPRNHAAWLSLLRPEREALLLRLGYAPLWRSGTALLAGPRL
ncbi:MAG: hypothetical protein HYZ75_04655 [Elusimicrobia bacterium]|nr:hypothetical protein [Elusimicrobiota bacterium]